MHIKFIHIRHTFQSFETFPNSKELLKQKGTISLPSLWCKNLDISKFFPTSYITVLLPINERKLGEIKLESRNDGKPQKNCHR